LRLIDTMIFRYFHAVGLLGEMLRLAKIAITTAVRREIKRKWADIAETVEQALADERIALCDFDPNSGPESVLYFKYWHVEGFGEGEAASMAVAFARGYTFVSHDLEAAEKMRGLGVNVMDWQDLVEELRGGGLISVAQSEEAKRKIQAMMRGR